MAEDKLSLGQYFKQERERLGISLRQIEERTKISYQILSFLENDEIEVLPPRAFLRGFLQVISKEYGLDGEEMIRLMDEALAQHEKIKNPSVGRNGSKTGLFIKIALAIIVALGLILAVTFWFSRNQTPIQQSLHNHMMPAIAMTNPASSGLTDALDI